MNLNKHLRQQGYDLIDGSIRNHKLLQIWLKVIFEEIQLYYEHIEHAFKSDIVLNEVTNPSLNITSQHVENYSFNVGVTVLEDIIESLGMGEINLFSNINSGKNINISFSDSITKEYPIGQIEEYLSRSDFFHKNRTLLKNANRNNLILITGIVYAKKLNVDIVTDVDISLELVTNLNNLSKGKIKFTNESNSVLKMSSSLNTFFPVAVKANRLDFDKGKFQRMKLITDNRNFY